MSSPISTSETKENLYTKLNQYLNLRISRIDSSSNKHISQIETFKYTVFDIYNNYKSLDLSYKPDSSNVKPTKERNIILDNENYNKINLTTSQSIVNTHTSIKKSNTINYSHQESYKNERKIRVKPRNDYDFNRKKSTSPKTRFFIGKFNLEKENLHRKELLRKVNSIDLTSHCLYETTSYKMKKKSMENMENKENDDDFPDFITKIGPSSLVKKDIYEKILTESGTIHQSPKRKKNKTWKEDGKDGKNYGCNKSIDVNCKSSDMIEVKVKVKEKVKVNDKDKDRKNEDLEKGVERKVVEKRGSESKKNRKDSSIKNKDKDKDKDKDISKINSKDKDKDNHIDNNKDNQLLKENENENKTKAADSNKNLSLNLKSKLEDIEKDEKIIMKEIEKDENIEKLKYKDDNINLINQNEKSNSSQIKKEKEKKTNHLIVTTESGTISSTKDLNVIHLDNENNKNSNEIHNNHIESISQSILNTNSSSSDIDKLYINLYNSKQVYDELILKITFPKSVENSIKINSSNIESKILEKQQSSLIQSMFKFIYILLKEDYSLINEENNGILINLFEEIYKKHNVFSLKDLFYKIINELFDFSRDDIDRINEFCLQFPSIFNSVEVMKENRVLSYYVFGLKSIKDFVLKKVDSQFTYGRVVYLEEVKYELRKKGVMN